MLCKHIKNIDSCLVARSCEGRSLLTDFVWKKELGAGAFGVVSLCANRYNGDERAIKIIKPPGGQVGVDFQEAAKETQLQQEIATSDDICKIYSWGTFTGVCHDHALLCCCFI